MGFTPTAESPLPESPPPSFDLGMLVALGCLPLSLLSLLAPDVPWEVRLIVLIFISGIGVHCIIRQIHRRPLTTVAYTGAWLLPVIGFVAAIAGVATGSFDTDAAGIACGAIGLSLMGLVAGFVTAKQIEAAIVITLHLRRRIRGGGRRQMAHHSIRERLDEESTPLEPPPTFGMPRRFGIRGLLIVTTWAAMLMGGLRACRVDPSVYFFVITFVAGVFAAQVLLFQGRSPIEASAWCGAFLLPAETLAVNLYWNAHNVFAAPTEPLAAAAAGCACLIPAGIILGAVAGAIGGGLYFLSEESLLWLTRGVPKITLAPITDADADVLLRWIIGPKFCRRWAGDRLTWPLGREHLLDRFATAQGEPAVRRIYKAVDLRTGNMLGYVELGSIDYRFRNALLELPLVDPDASERGRIGVLLLQAIAAEAFGRLGLISIKVSAETEQNEVALCCKKAWLNNCYHALPRSGAGWITVFRRRISER